jgi:hypothetical protein
MSAHHFRLDFMLAALYHENILLLEVFALQSALK